MSDATLDGLGEFLAGIYQTLKRHEQALFDLMVDTEAAMAVLKQQNLQFPASFAEHRETALDVSAQAHELQLHLFDGIIARLRDT